MINFLFGLTVGILATVITVAMAIEKLKKDSDESVKNKPYVMYMKYYTHED